MLQLVKSGSCNPGLLSHLTQERGFLIRVAGRNHLVVLKLEGEDLLASNRLGIRLREAWMILYAIPPMSVREGETEWLENPIPSRGQTTFHPDLTCFLW